MRNVYIVDAVRSPGGKANKGSLATTRPDDLAAFVVKGLLERTKVDPAVINDLIVGCAFPEGEQGMNVGRIIAHRAGLPVHVPAMTVNRFCSSGLQTIAIAAGRIAMGEADAIIAGGTESMSMVPMGGNKFSANPTLVAEWPETYASMGITAELVADKFNVSREDQDAFAARSHQRAAKAVKDGTFAEEIIPIDIDVVTIEGTKAKHETKTMKDDEGIRMDTTPEALSKLKPAFREGGSVTAGNSSQMTDGAGMALVVSEEFLKEHNLTPLARFVAFQAAGVEPEIMGIGPVEAVPPVAKQAGLTMKDIQLIELNEAFAAQSLAVVRQLGLNEDIVNVHGGAIALGHPLGATGAKLTATLLHEMRRQDLRYGMVTMCVGGGMGAAGIFERM